MATNNSPFTIQEPKQYDNLANQMNQQSRSVQTMSAGQQPAPVSTQSNDPSRGDVMRWWYGNGGKANTGIGFDGAGGILDQYKNQQSGSKTSQLDKNGTFNQVNNSVSTPSPTPTPTPGFDENKFGDLFNKHFGDFQTKYDERMSALEKMLSDLSNQYKYIQNTGAQQKPSGPEYSGDHVFDSGGSGSNPGDVGYTQKDNAMNDALYRYLSNTWNGGF